MQKGNRKLTMACLGITIAFALMFLVNKYIEWMGEIRRGIYPNGPALLKLPDGEKIFYGLYYSMTGLHGLHVLAGVVALSIVLDFVRREKITSTDFIKLESVGLYWHLVDVIWIFLLPLLYLAA
jgi:cytochrome c oxidase subunit 3